MYCELANKLVVEAKRTEQLNSRNNARTTLPVHNDELVRNVLKEVTQLKKNLEFFKEQQDIMSTEGISVDSNVMKCQYFVNLLCLERNKRCLLGYQKLRSDMLDSMAWENNGMDVMGSNLGEENSNLTHQEQEYLKKYSELITEMKSGELTDIDLSGSLIPPKEVFIDVRVLKDAGEIQTEYGVFNLIKDSQFFVRQSDVERLIQQGFLQKI
ncbi:similar to Saccharomyces cerevisiae YDR013W PSF1 Subunit of the GINS complex [Maudiozyma saulgeensis]|uniref:DNA replication complex GINS protein PSF1 n=1 Tax=Maudiozyma saulgeensis TaxID=1789683 RepID=A0A1X7R3T0_9SACH|nr:similar to Saccharomyces cerevisiae YDR013W PSF1 Subunit of the GINS complex [Kazachstania saulgeensis]